MALVALVASTSACADTSPPDTGRRVVTVFGTYRGAEAERFTRDLDAWAAGRGIDVRYTGSGNLASDLRERVADADPPDIALVPQPGLVADLYDQGVVRPLPPSVVDAVDRNLEPVARRLGEVDGTPVAFPYRVTVKGLVFYRPAVLASLGLRPPTDLDGLERLVADIRAKGRTPWCLGIEAQRSTGWAATDWVENLLVRRAGPDAYRDWVDGSVRFDDPRVVAAFDEFRSLVLPPDRVAGGLGGVVGTNVQRAHAPLFADPPGCVLYQQANFALAWMPPDLRIGPDGDLDVFLLPGTEAGSVPPVVVGADLVTAFADRPEVTEVLEYLAGPDAVRSWTAAGGLITLQRTLGPDTLGQPVDRTIAGFLRQAPDVVFDGSDAMPSRVGTDLFWTQITAWITGGVSYRDLAGTLDGTMANGAAVTSTPGSTPPVPGTAVAGTIPAADPTG